MKAPNRQLVFTRDTEIGASRDEKSMHTGNGEQDDLLVGPLLRGVVRLGNAAGGHALGFLGPWNVAEETR